MQTNLNSIAQRCLALTGCLETSSPAPECFGKITGDFDGMGLSYGVLQWNIGQGTMQVLLADMLAAHRDAMERIFADRTPDLEFMLRQTRTEQLVWARSIQELKSRAVLQPWRDCFAALGRTAEFQAIQVIHAQRIYQKAFGLCKRFGVTTERALALMFDICVQNGSIDSEVEAHIRSDYGKLSPTDEVAKLLSIANRRADASNPKFAEDVRTRKLTIAKGEGVVHQIPYHLEEQFGIRLQPIAA